MRTIIANGEGPQDDIRDIVVTRSDDKGETWSEPVLVVDPLGEVVAESRARDIRDEMIVVDLRADLAKRRPRNMQQRRPEVFGAITRMTD